MRKHLSLLLLLLLVASSTVFGQVNFGPRVTLLQSRMSLKNEAPLVSEADATTGYQLGVFMRASFSGISVQPELLYSKMKSGYQIEGAGAYKLEFDRLNLPIMVGYQLGPVRLQGGPTFGLVLENTRQQPNGTVLYLNDEYSTSSVGYQAGIGVDFHNFVIDIKYERDLTNQGDNLDRGLEAEQRQTHFVFALGYKIF